MARSRKKAQEPTATEIPVEQTPAAQHELVADRLADSTPVPVEQSPVHIRPEAIVHAPSESAPTQASGQPRLPEAEPHSAHEKHHESHSEHSHAARQQQPREYGHTEHRTTDHELAQSHAESVGKREFKPSPDPFGIAGDYVAGVRLLESKKYREMVLKFEERPSDGVISMLKDAGYRYNAPSKAWTHGLNQDNAMTVRIDAEKLFHEVAGMIRSEKGINHGYGGRD